MNDLSFNFSDRNSFFNITVTAYQPWAFFMWSPQQTTRTVDECVGFVSSFHIPGLAVYDLVPALKYLCMRVYGNNLTRISLLSMKLCHCVNGTFLAPSNLPFFLFSTRLTYSFFRSSKILGWPRKFLPRNPSGQQAAAVAMKHGKMAAIVYLGHNCTGTTTERAIIRLSLLVVVVWQ